MAIRKQAISGKSKEKYTDFDDYGNEIQLEPNETLAFEPLTFKLVGLQSHWKTHWLGFAIDELPMFILVVNKETCACTLAGKILPSKATKYEHIRTIVP